MVNTTWQIKPGSECYNCSICKRTGIEAKDVFANIVTGEKFVFNSDGCECSCMCEVEEEKE